jgi:4-hydroxythreonine-4-phosphate dehydrogenase
LTATVLTTLLPLIITSGEPAGIGPELALQAARAAQATLTRRVQLIGDMEHLRRVNQHLSLGLELVPAGTHSDRQHAVYVHHIPLANPVQFGVLNAANAPYVLSTLDLALHLIEAGRAAGMVTCPVHKGVINDAGIPFTGHTEYLANACCVDDVVMLLADPNPQGLKVALASTHLPLAEVSGAITQEGLLKTMHIIDADMRRYFGVHRPNIWLTGLNPHAGEGGHLGREEIETIEPAIAAAQAQGLWVSGPYPADTVYSHRNIAQADVVLAMYHDQGLPVLKYASFGRAVNVTLGLPIIRTSVDHGTALDLAGTGNADVGSLQAALSLAHHMASCQLPLKHSQPSSIDRPQT